MRSLIIVTAAALGLSACQTAGPVHRQITTQFDAATFAYAKTPGTGRIEGQAFMRQRGGDVVTAAGEDVTLMPAVPYTEEMMRIGDEERAQGRYGSMILFTNREITFVEYTKRTVADASGAFVFDHLSAGDYYVITRVRWDAPGEHGALPQGGEMVAKVTVRNGETTRAVISQ